MSSPAAGLGVVGDLAVEIQVGPRLRRPRRRAPPPAPRRRGSDRWRSAARARDRSGACARRSPPRTAGPRPRGTRRRGRRRPPRARRRRPHRVVGDPSGGRTRARRPGAGPCGRAAAPGGSRAPRRRSRLAAGLGALDRVPVAQDRRRRRPPRPRRRRADGGARASGGTCSATCARSPASRSSISSDRKWTWKSTSPSSSSSLASSPRVGGVGELVGLLDGVRDDRALVLLAVPGALHAQSARELVEAPEGVGDVGPAHEIGRLVPPPVTGLTAPTAGASSRRGRRGGRRRLRAVLAALDGVALAAVRHLSTSCGTSR